MESAVKMALCVLPSVVATGVPVDVTWPLPGALLYIDFGPGDTLELMQLNLQTNTTSKLQGLGKGGSFFSMVSSVYSDTYYATLQYQRNGPVFLAEPRKPFLPRICSEALMGCSI